MFRKTNPFYLSKEWRRLRREVLAGDKYECQICKAKGHYTKATHVHHVRHLDEFPDLALDKFYVDGGKQKRNLISVCKDCHEKIHGFGERKKKQPLTEERWE